MAPHRTLTRPMCLEIIELRKQGAKDPEIAARYFVSSNTVFKTMEYYKLIDQYKAARHFKTLQRLNKAIEMRKKGFRNNNIWQELGYCDFAELHKSLKKHGLDQKFKQAKFGTAYRFANNTKSKPLSLPWVYNRRAVFGESFKEIGDAVGSSSSRIYRFCKKYNIPKATPEQVAANREKGNDCLW